MPYKPTEIDLTWAREVLEQLTDRGVLAYPATGLIYRLDKQAKTLVLVNPEILIFFSSFVTHEMTKEVFKAIGYEVIG